MIDLRELFLDNPELRRNWQIELSPKRLLTTAIITSILALLVLPSLLTSARSTVISGISPYLMIVLWSQKITLVLGGAVSCWRSVRRERDLNTFDFQRITRLSPLELAVGKLFGAPALAYFVTLLLVPPAFVSAVTTSPLAVSFLLGSYVSLFTSALAIHAFALMISTVSDKGGALSGVVILLMLQVFPAIGWFAALQIYSSRQTLATASEFRFYGIPFPPTILWAVLELGFAAFLLLAVVRNIKLDLEAMQLFSVGQGLGFAAYCNFVWIGFYPWQSASIGNSSGGLLLFGLLFFYLVGIGVLQSRERLRRQLREVRSAAAAAGNLIRPIGSLLLGAAVTGVVIIVLIAQGRAQAFALLTQGRTQDVASGSAQEFFLVLYFVAWIARDLLYLQWMKVRPGRSPLRKAFLYLAVFYVSTSILFRASLTSSRADVAAFSAWFSPFALLRGWTDAQWTAASGLWLLALLAQLATAASFAYLYLQEVAALSRAPQATPPAAPPALPPHLSSTPA